MSEASPIVFFETDPATAQFLQIGLAQHGSGSRVTFRGNDELPIGAGRARAAVRSPDGPPQIYTISIQSDRDLMAATEALRRYNVKGWVTVATPEGPKQVELSAYLQQLGLAGNA
jgi:hypothetical protein